MSSLQPGGVNPKDAPMKSGQMEQTLRCISVMDSNQHLTASYGQHSQPLDASQRCSNLPPGAFPETSVVIRDALRFNLPHHLIFKTIQRRVQTYGRNYADVSELLTDLFTPSDRSVSADDQEVPMETNQLEDALMMNSLAVKKALQMGVPPHLIKPKVRAKILMNQVGYADLTELLKDLNGGNM